ncbi:MAG: response regulator transcription factor [Sulfurimicrobium sp.]|nr:response regulator transcription factor [Sulfurimicrobium sp.]
MQLETEKKDSPCLLLVDDDKTFSRVMARALVKRGFRVIQARDVDSAMMLAEADPPDYAVVDLKLPVHSGLELIKYLKESGGNTRIVMLTGFASIATAVGAIRLGATHYLAKPADADEIVAALHRDGGDANVSVAPLPISVDRLKWEHIQKVLAENENNISATARSLNMHRRTLQRRLAKHPVRE